MTDETKPSSQTNCIFCGNRLVGTRFEVKQFDKRGELLGTINVCSIVCLVRWSYAYMVKTGVKGVIRVKGLIDRARDLLRGKVC
jgi:hypothetical protein